MLKCAGRFVLLTRLISKTMPNRISYNKPYKSAKDLTQLLQTRGLIINDFNRAENYINHIGYYRLSAYMYPHLEFPKEKHIYKSNKTFQIILDLYKFDKKLRLLIFNEIEKIEIAVRSSIVNNASEIFNDPYWITDARYFVYQDKFAMLVVIIHVYGISKIQCLQWNPYILLDHGLHCQRIDYVFTLTYVLLNGFWISFLQTIP